MPSPKYEDEKLPNIMIMYKCDGSLDAEGTAGYTCNFPKTERTL